MHRLSDSHSGDGKGQEEGEEEEGTESAEESAHRRAIEQEKAVYKDSFDALRVLKPEIEHVRKVCTYVHTYTHILT